jgi:hypothetical protein
MAYAPIFGQQCQKRGRSDAMLIFTVLTVVVLVEVALYSIWGGMPED